MASSLNMELENLSCSEEGEQWRARGAEGSRFQHLCCACLAGTPALQSWAWPCQGGLPSIPQRPRSQASRGGVQSEGWNLSSGAGSPWLCPFRLLQTRGPVVVHVCSEERCPHHLSSSGFCLLLHIGDSGRFYLRKGCCLF